MDDIARETMPSKLTADTRPTPFTATDPALREAWRSITEYAVASTRRKDTHSRVRLIVIVLTAGATMLATVAALLAPLPDTPETITLKLAMRLLLVAVPLIISGILAFSLQFMPNTAWIAYRIGEQRIRREVYLYRLRAGAYRTPDPVARQRLLIDALVEIDHKVGEMGASQPFMQNFRDVQGDELTLTPQRTLPGPLARLVRPVASALGLNSETAPVEYDLDSAECRRIVRLNAPDNGYSAMTIDEYIAWRIDDQLNWYVNRLNTDFGKFRRWRRSFLFITGAGAFFAGIDLGWIVAFTTAIGVAITMYIDLRMYGRTYAIYHQTAKALRRLKTDWKLLTATSTPTEAQVAEFVERAEALFSEEQRRWLEEALQSQQSVDQSIAQSLNAADPGRRMTETPTLTRNPFDAQAARRTTADEPPIHTDAMTPDEAAESILGHDMRAQRPHRPGTRTDMDGPLDAHADGPVHAHADRPVQAHTGAPVQAHADTPEAVLPYEDYPPGEVSSEPGDDAHASRVNAEMPPREVAASAGGLAGDPGTPPSLPGTNGASATRVVQLPPTSAR